jgi:hypothetical protein
MRAPALRHAATLPLLQHSAERQRAPPRQSSCTLTHTRNLTVFPQEPNGVLPVDLRRLQQLALQVESRTEPFPQAPHSATHREETSARALQQTSSNTVAAAASRSRAYTAELLSRSDKTREELDLP